MGTYVSPLRNFYNMKITQDTLKTLVGRANDASSELRKMADYPRDTGLLEAHNRAMRTLNSFGNDASRALSGQQWGPLSSLQDTFVGMTRDGAEGLANPIRYTQVAHRLDELSERFSKQIRPDGAPFDSSNM